MQLSFFKQSSIPSGSKNNRAMKKLTKFSLIVGVVILVTAIAVLIKGLPQCNMDRANLTALVTVDGTITSTTKISSILDEAITTITSKRTKDNIIIFIHGRGKHPCHAFDNKLLADLEKNYSAKVIMFHWPSWQGEFAYPEQQARSAAPDFASVLKAIAKYKENNSNLVKDVKFTLFTHSMGSLVLEEFIKRGNQHVAENLFDTLLINASASSAISHASWVDKISLSKSVYVTVNKFDPTLGKAELFHGWQHKDFTRRLLGKALTSKNGVDYELADNAKYIDFAESDLRHVYYLHRYLGKSTVAKHFFNTVLNGNPAILNKQNGVTEIRKRKIYIMRKNFLNMS